MNDRQSIESFKQDLQQYSLEQLRYNTGDGVWSLGQMYRHLIDVADEYLDHVEACSKACVEQPLGKSEVGEHLYEVGGFPMIRIKLPDLPGNTPDHSQNIEDLTEGLDRVVRRMIDWETRVDGISPHFKEKHEGFGWLTAREWLELIGMHFRHHLRQKKELEARWELFS
ncbi:DinB family protein [Paenibacillus rigui]|uniref:DinB-like domain-containing protein n=1 Tax=Paenibacillus rigui TaxID=554312 RepID=A0A229UPF8_9BACL|nr:DinB family protein [Paenibacillus rigui]OXM85161.1 hypothetical protein CF651_16290 [Paenibacillus rigui]